MRTASRLSSDGDRPPRIAELRRAHGQRRGRLRADPAGSCGQERSGSTGLESAGFAIQFAGAIESCALGCDAASGNGVSASELDKLFARRARVTVAFGIEAKSARENVPSVRLDLSKTGMCGAMSFSLTSHAKLSAEP